MRTHVIEVGPTALRRLCCGGATVADAEAEQVAFQNIDDPVALVDLRPVTVASLWQEILTSIDCGASDDLTLVHPSWWSPARLEVVSTAAQVLVGTPEMRPRSWLLMRGTPAGTELETVVVEIADDFVVITGADVVAETRHRGQAEVTEAVARSVLAMAADAGGTVVVDAPATVRGAGTLAASIVKELSSAGRGDVLLADDLRVRKLVGELKPMDARCPRRSRPATAWRVHRRRALAVVVLAVGALISVGAWHGGTQPHTSERSPTTFVVEGHVALEVPAQWPVQRIVAGPGSARVQITSPADPEVALHVTQSRVALPSFDATAEFLKTAIDAAPAGVFVDFDPAGRRAGHPVVTYREIRPGHDIRWTVWVEKAVRISIGCQSRSRVADAVSNECELAVRTARVVD